MARPDYVRWLRARVGHARVILVYASAVITDGSGRVLLQRRSDFPWWGLPGGALERGECLEDCLVREVREETGLYVVLDRLVGLYSSPDFDVTYPNGDQVQQFTACFACHAAGGALQPDGDEVLDLADFPPTRLPQVPSWYEAMVADFYRGRAEASFRQGRPGQRTSQDYAAWLRHLAGAGPVIVVGAGTCVRDDAGRVLLVRRSGCGDWEIPAGAMELGERVDVALVRQVKKQTGLQVEPLRVVGIYSGPECLCAYPNGHQLYVVSTLFASRVVGGSLRADGREVTEARFFRPDGLPHVHPRDRIRLADALAERADAVWR